MEEAAMAVGGMALSNKKKGEFGRLCVFASRLCGAFSAIIVLLCGLVTLLPLPSLTTSLSQYPRCLGTGFIFIIASVLMFFCEAASPLGQCVEKLSFLLVVSKYLKHWHRAALYMGVSIAPLVLWCLSASTILPMLILVLSGALNFVLAIGQKGDHSNEYVAARWHKLGDEEMDDIDDENNEQETTTENESSTINVEQTV